MSDGDQKTVLVVANETVGGRALIQAVKERAARGPARFCVICPQNEPRHGYVVYDDLVAHAAQNRLETTLRELREEGIEAEGQVMDPDPYNATTDAIAEYGADEVIISTHPGTRSGWLRRDLIDRIRRDTGLPVTHVVVDLDADRAHKRSSLVVANQTVGGKPLIDLLKQKAALSPHRFIVICPVGDSTSDEAAARLEGTLSKLHEAGLEATGQVGDPDPFTAIQNALQFYVVDEIVISTFPGERSGWLRTNLIERTRSATGKPVEHIEVSAETASEEAAA
jgi:DNA-binding LacI/PurR family transcriptional regulator